MKPMLSTLILLQPIIAYEPIDDVFNQDLSYFESDDSIDDLTDESIQVPTPAAPIAPPPAQVPVAVQPKPQAPKTKSINHPYYTSFEKQNPIYVSLSYLYWTVSEPGLHYAVTKKDKTNEQETVGATANLGQGCTVNNSYVFYPFGQIKKTHFEFSSGVRAEASYQFKHAPWNLASEYTYFQTSASQTINRPSTEYGYLRGLNVYQQNFVIAEQAVSKNLLNYQNGKLLFAVAWNPLKELLVNFKFGPQATWLKQTLNYNFYPAQVTNPLHGPFTCLNTMENRAWGVGLFTGIGVDGHLGAGFSLGFDAGISGMSGQARFHNFSTSDNPILDNYEDFFNIYQKPSYQFMGQGMLKGTLGYSYCFNSIALRLEASYEFNALLNMIDMYRIGDKSGKLKNDIGTNYQSNSVYLQGVNIKLGLGF